MPEKQKIQPSDIELKVEPLSERPIDEIRAVQEALECNQNSPEGGHYSVILNEGKLHLFETGELATIEEGNNSTCITNSLIWSADISLVEKEINRRGL
jgi:hypothetical protein